MPWDPSLHYIAPGNNGDHHDDNCVDGNNNDDEYFTTAFTDPGMIRKHNVCTAVSLYCN